MFPPTCRKLAVFLALAAVLLMPMAAMADTVAYFQMNNANSALAGFSTPFVDVTITVPGDAGDGLLAPATFEVVAQTGVYNATTPVQYLLGGNDMFAIQGLSGVTLVAGSVMQGTGFTTANITLLADKQMDGFGKFNWVFSNEDGFTQSVISFKFTATNTFDSANDVLTFLENHVNTSNYYAAAHIYTGGLPLSTDNNFDVTGFAANGGQTGPPVPVPPTVLLLGSGLLGLGVIRWRKKN